MKSVHNNGSLRLQKNNDINHYIIEGTGAFMNEKGEEQPLKAGDFALVNPDEKHQYRNKGDKPFKIICGVPSSLSKYLMQEGLPYLINWDFNDIGIRNAIAGFLPTDVRKIIENFL